jgi:hypothetical protein
VALRLTFGNTGIWAMPRRMLLLVSLTIAILALSASAQSNTPSSSDTTSPTADYTNWVGSIDTSRLPKGTATITSSNAEATALAYQSGMATAARIASAVCSSHPSSLVLFNNLADMDALRNLFIVRAQLLAARRDTPKFFATVDLQAIPAVPGLTPNPLPVGDGPPGMKGNPLWHATANAPGRVVVPILSAADAALSLVSLFKTDSTLTGVTMTADDLSLQLMVAGELKRNGQCTGPILQAAYSVPPLVAPHARAVSEHSPLIDLVLDALDEQSDLQNQSSLLTSLLGTPLTNALSSLQKIVGDSSQQSLDADEQAAHGMRPGAKRDAALAAVASKRGALAAIPTVQADIGITQKQTSAINNLQTQISSLTTSLTSSGAAALQTALKAEALNCALQPGDQCVEIEAKPFVLVTKMSAIGGDSATRQNIFHTTLSFSGEITATYMLLGANGEVASGGMIQCYGAVSQTKPITTDMLRTNKVSCRDYSDKDGISY